MPKGGRTIGGTVSTAAVEAQRIEAARAQAEQQAAAEFDQEWIVTARYDDPLLENNPASFVTVAFDNENPVNLERTPSGAWGFRPPGSRGIVPLESMSLRQRSRGGIRLQGTPAAVIKGRNTRRRTAITRAGNSAAQWERIRIGDEKRGFF